MAHSDTVNSAEYFATLPTDDFIKEAHGKIDEFYDDLLATGIYWLWARSYSAYYGANLAGPDGQMFDSAELQRSGNRGQVVKAKFNHFRSVLKHTLQLATATKPAYGCRASNTDYKSQTQTILGNGLIDFYLREKKLQRILAQAVETALVTFEAWIHSTWDAASGEDYMVDPTTQKKVKEGDVKLAVHNGLDVPRDIYLTEEDEHSWLFVRTQRNRYDLAARYTDLAERILQVSSDEYKYAQKDSFSLNGRTGDKDCDQVTVWTFYHRKTDAMPQGRIVEFVGDIGLVDGPLPYRKIPLYKLTPENLMGTPYGYSPAADLLGPQQVHDILSSTIATNQSNYGLQSVWTKRNDNITVNQLTGGGKNLQSDAKPEPIQLTQTAGEIFQFRKDVEGEIETLSGINSTVRGNPEASLKSGSALALVVAQSIQFSSMLEQSLNSCFEDIGTDIIEKLRDFSKTKRVANILGKSSRPFRKEFTGDDLSQINRVVVEAQSPLSKTISGRLELADNLWAKGAIKDPQKWVNVLQTGQIEGAIEGSTHESLNIRAENEELREGRQVPVILTDFHPSHIDDHRSILSNPESRRNPRLVKVVLDHIQEHLRLWRSMDPALLAVMGMPPAPMPMMPPPPPGMGPQGPGPGGPGLPGGPAPAPAAAVVRRQVPGEANQPREPSMPSLPGGAPPESVEAFKKVG